jgi:uncharacterized protein
MDIPVRRMPFDFPTDVDLVFVPDDPGTSYTFLGAWFMLPYLEPYLIRTIQAAMPKVADATLREDMKRFCAQEGQHFRQHAKANEMIRGRRPGFARLAELETALDAEYRRFSETKSLRFNLAYAEGFESLTAAVSTAQIEVGLFDNLNPLAQLALWHVTEELEHRTVAYEAYDAVSGGYLHRMTVGVWAQIHYLGWAARLAKIMREADPEVFTRLTPEARARAAAVRKVYWSKALPRWLSTYAPWYSPRRLRLPAAFEAVRDRFSAQATTVA